MVERTVVEKTVLERTVVERTSGGKHLSPRELAFSMQGPQACVLRAEKPDCNILPFFKGF